MANSEIIGAGQDTARRAPKINTITCGDCLEVMPYIPDCSVDAIITDPPYGINIKTGFNGDDKSIAYDDGFSVMFFLDSYLKEFSRILKPDSAVYIFTRYDVMPYWWLRLKGFFDVKNCIVWSKGGGGTGDLKGNYIGTHEMILFAVKGRHILSGKRESNVWLYGKCKPENHPMQKPSELIENIITHSVVDGGIVFDPFCGSGTFAVACINTGRNYIGIEKEEKYCRIAEERIHALRSPAQNTMEICHTAPNSAMLQGLKPHAGNTGTSA